MIKKEGGIREQDVRLIKILICVLAAVCLARFLIFPAIETRQEQTLAKTEAEEQQAEMQAVIDGRSSSETRIEKYRAGIAEIKDGFYDTLENREIDSLVTGLALEHNLFPVYLNISDSEKGLPGAYLLAESTVAVQAEESDASDAADASDSASVADTSDDAAASDETADVTEASMLQATAITTVDLTLEGSESEVWAFLDDIANNYPGIQVRSFRLNNDNYVNSEYQTVEAYSCSCTLAVYTCDVPEETNQ